MVQSKNLYVKVQRKRRRKKTRGNLGKGEERQKRKATGRRGKKRNGSRSAFAGERPRGRDRRQKHRRPHVGQKSLARGSGENSLANCFILKYARAGMHLGAHDKCAGAFKNERGGRDVCLHGIRKRSRERSIRFFFAREILRLRDDPPGQVRLLFQDRILARLFEHSQHHVEVYARCVAYIWYQKYDLIGSNIIWNSTPFNINKTHILKERDMHYNLFSEQIIFNNNNY